jgi:RNA polymerase sigma factor (TIGR02999 family)
VHEAYLRLVRPGADFQSRLHFFNAAALAMRRILIDHAEAKRAEKRGGGAVEISLDDFDAADANADQPTLDMIALDEAMKSLESISQRQHQVVMLRFFACLKDAEIAELLDVSEKTVRRDWATARLWLQAEMSK